MDNKKLELTVLCVAFIGLSILTFLVFQPFLCIMMIAIVLAILFHPLYKNMIAVFHGGKSVVACFIVIIALVFVIIPFIVFGLQILGQAQNFFSLTHDNQAGYVIAIQQHANTLIQHVVPSYSLNITDILAKIQSLISDNLGNLVSQTTYIFFQIFFLLFTFFLFLRDGDQMLETCISLSPFGKEQNRKVIDSTYRTITSLVREMFYVGLIRFALIAAAFYVLGIPNAFVWGSIGGIIGMIPGLGTPFVVIPTIIYLALCGNTFAAIGMAIFGLLVFFFIDNLLSTYLFGKDWKVPPLFILFSILGGITLFGPLGFIFGPIILSLFMSAIDMYKILVLKRE